MSDQTKTEEEPSIEEILDSIRQIISEDEEDEGSVESEPEPVPEPEPEPEPLDQSAIDDIDFDSPVDEPSVEEEEVIDLTDRVDDNENDVDIDWADNIEEEPEPEPEEESEPEPEKIIEENNILTEAAEDAAYTAISELAKKTAVEVSGITLEDIVRSEIKPLLRSWLDKNLPVVIERLVREELERVSKRVLDE